MQTYIPFMKIMALLILSLGFWKKALNLSGYDDYLNQEPSWEETVSARFGLVPMIWVKISIFRTNRVIPRGARAYCREDFARTSRGEI